MAPLCAKCNINVKNKDTLKCSKCKGVYDLRCAGRSYKLFELMSADRRNAWICIQCRSNLNNSSRRSSNAPSIKNTDEYNITLRRKMPKNKSPSPELPCTPQESKNVTLQRQTTVNISTHNSFDSLSDPDDNEAPGSPLGLSSSIDNSTRSLPNLESQTQTFLVDELRQQIKALQEQLLGADSEVQKLLNENYELQDVLCETRKKCDLYKTMLQSRTVASPQKTPINKVSKIKKISKRRLSVSQMASSVMENQKSRSCENSPENTLLASTPESVWRSAGTNTSDKLLSSPLNQKAHNIGKNKVIFFSDNNRNKILQIIKGQDYLQHFNYCHHVQPGSGLQNLLTAVSVQAKKLTKNDYCVILIGERDFHSTQDYHRLVSYTRKKLQKLNNTNYIIACPTYICGSQLFNARVDAFNMLLFNDISMHNYSAFFDPNTNLTFDMFSSWNGKLMNIGMRNIMENLKTYLPVTVVDTKLDINVRKTFFRK